MFSNVVVGVKDPEASRDALCLARALTSANGTLTLAHVQVTAPKPAPDSGAAGAAARRRDGLERLAALRDESQLDAKVAWGEAREVRRGLHDVARARDADLLVIGASREDDVYRDLVGDDTRDLLENPPCAVAVAPIGYSARPASLQTIGVAESIDDEVLQARDRMEELGVEAHAEYGDPVEQLGRFGRSVDPLVLGSHRQRLLGGGHRAAVGRRTTLSAPRAAGTQRARVTTNDVDVRLDKFISIDVGFRLWKSI